MSILDGILKNIGGAPDDVVNLAVSYDRFGRMLSKSDVLHITPKQYS